MRYIIFVHDVSYSDGENGSLLFLSSVLFYCHDDDDDDDNFSC